MSYFYYLNYLNPYWLYYGDVKEEDFKESEKIEKAVNKIVETVKEDLKQEIIPPQDEPKDKSIIKECLIERKGNVSYINLPQYIVKEEEILETLKNLKIVKK